MDEYISKHEPIEEIKRIYCTSCNSYNGAMCRACEHQDDIDIIEDTKAADVQPVRRGRWELTDNPSFRKCSECGAWWSSDITDNCFTKYCPKCGARMDGDTE